MTIMISIYTSINFRVWDCMLFYRMYENLKLCDLNELVFLCPPQAELGLEYILEKLFHNPVFVATHNDMIKTQPPTFTKFS